MVCELFAMGIHRLPITAALFALLAMVCPSCCCVPLSSTTRAPASPAISVLRPSNVCSLDECFCTSSAHPNWVVVNCTFGDHQKVDLMNGSVPSSAIEVTITGGLEVRMSAQLFTRTRDLQLVGVSRVGLLRVRRHAFLNLTAQNTLFEVTRCGSLYFESKAFTHTKGPIQVNISLVEDVLVQGETFSWLLSLHIRDVPRLELAAGAFLMESRSAAASTARHGPVTKINMENVLLPDVPPHAFGSSAAELRFDRCEMRRVHADAFSANTLSVVEARRTAFHRLDGGAFAQKTLIDRLVMHDCLLRSAGSGAILSATTNLTLHSSRFLELSPGAINITVATVTIVDNEFVHLMSNAIELKSWNRLRIERNSFNDMDPYAINTPFIYMNDADKYELTFIENEMIKMSSNSLSFLEDALKTHGFLEVKYENNYFAQVCHCNIDKWLAILFGNTTFVATLMERSYCTINTFFANCFNMLEGNVLMGNFTGRICGPENNIFCKSVKQQAEGVTDEIKNTRFPQRINKNDTMATSHNGYKNIPLLIFLVVTLGIAIIIIITAISWLKKKGCCNRLNNAIRYTHSSYTSFLDKYFGFNSGIDRTQSISRLSINEYTERHRLNESRMIEFDEITADTNENDELILMENKATQTLPEELTKELLDSLREKLEDPDNYMEAREMIEHLYDLIKVEESCNNNPPERLLFDDNTENLYDIIQPAASPPQYVKRNNKAMISKGTKVPSFEKLNLSPYEGNTALCHEYFEPKDHTQHLYDELTCNGDTNIDKPQYIGLDLGSEQVQPRGPFLRAIRDKINISNKEGKTKATKSNESKELASPSSSSTRTLSLSSKMSNRPLPLKPTAFDTGEGTSGLNR